MTQQRFAPWRDLIDPNSEVFWPDQLQSTWFALGRRSYLSKSQLGGIVFSAETTAEARRRAQSLAAVFPPGQWFNETSGKDRSRWATSAADIRAACAVTDIDFVVANANFATDLPPVEWPMAGQRVYLYACRVVRRGRS
jgi:alkanesulfonate monooxygenase SsuD/methylene tetrahydromethanopterin reductase-like flavin-dependent oxidoreductase (luciferase family)